MKTSWEKLRLLPRNRSILKNQTKITEKRRKSLSIIFWPLLRLWKEIVLVVWACSHRQISSDINVVWIIKSRRQNRRSRLISRRSRRISRQSRRIFRQNRRISRRSRRISRRSRRISLAGLNLSRRIESLAGIDLSLESSRSIRGFWIWKF